MGGENCHSDLNENKQYSASIIVLIFSLNM